LKKPCDLRALCGKTGQSLPCPNSCPNLREVLEDEAPRIRSSVNQTGTRTRRRKKLPKKFDHSLPCLRAPVVPIDRDRSNSSSKLAGEHNKPMALVAVPVISNSRLAGRHNKPLILVAGPVISSSKRAGRHNKPLILVARPVISPSKPAGGDSARVDFAISPGNSSNRPAGKGRLPPARV
jgi:hypothetical protein